MPCQKCGGEVVFVTLNGKPVPFHQGINGCHVYLKKNLRKASRERGTRIRDLCYRRRLFSFIHKGWCEKEVWFYENELGAKVWFDSPNPPWPKHECRPSTDHTSKNKPPLTLKEKSWIPVVLYYENFQYKKNIRQIQIRASETGESFGIFDVLHLDDWRRVILRENWKAAWLAEEFYLRAPAGSLVIYCPKKREFNDGIRIDYMEIKVSKDPQGRFSL